MIKSQTVGLVPKVLPHVFLVIREVTLFQHDSKIVNSTNPL